VAEWRRLNLYYCHTCAIKSGKLNPADPIELTGTQYQLEKFIKHTAPSTTYPLNSIFTGPASESYRNYIVTAVASGCVQIDGNQTNIVWVASATTGFTFRNGTFVAYDDAVKVVFHDDQFKIHGFPIGSAEISSATCIGCGKPTPM
jgi:hypothetical protein